MIWSFNLGEYWFKELRGDTNFVDFNDASGEVLKLCFVDLDFFKLMFVSLGHFKFFSKFILFEIIIVRINKFII